jgi:glycosyltransferase involved in cell wall biosynthesis
LSRFGIDARAAAEEPAGRGRFVRELLRALAARNDDHVYELYARTRWEEPFDERFDWRLSAARDPLWHLRAARAASSSCAGFLSTNSYLTAWFLRVPGVVVVYDLVSFRPEASARRSSALIERATFGPGVRRARSLVCISEATRRDLVGRYSSAAAKSVVVPLAADERFARERSAQEVEAVRSRYGLDRDFVLCAGTLEPRKNLARLIDAYAALPATLRAKTQLALVGPKGWDFAPVVEQASLHARDVSLLGHVTDDELACLYRACAVFAYPSLYEGFGLPVLEALAAGAPTITSNVSSLPEVAGEAAVYVDPTSVEEIRAAIEGLLASPEQRERLRALGPSRAAEFSWAGTAAGVLAQLEAVSRS